MPDATATPELEVSWPLPEVMSDPVLTVVAPVKADEPESVREPLPVLVRPAAPDTAPEKVTSATVVSVRSVEPRSTVPLKVRAPTLPVEPKVISPPRIKALPKERAVEPIPERVPALSVRLPGPKALLFPAKSEPALSVVPPV